MFCGSFSVRVIFFDGSVSGEVVCLGLSALVVVSSVFSSVMSIGLWDVLVWIMVIEDSFG